MNRKCVEGLHARGVKIELDPFRIPDMRSTVPASPAINEMISNKVSENATSIWAIMPPKFLARPGRKILFTMMESKGFHQSFLAKINNADEIWLPSKFNVDMFEEDRARVRADSSLRRSMPLDLEVKYMPLGVDTNLFKPINLESENIDAKNIFGIKTKSFVFCSLFGWSLRKGYDVLLRSYFEEFTSDDDVSLVIASRKDGSTNQKKIEEIREDIKRYALKYCKDPKKMPHIVHIGQALKEEHLPILYNMSDCYVLPSRGEGFGLPFAEAGACFPEGTKIWDGEKLTNIEHCYIGQNIINHKGEEDKIINKSVRKYSGNMVSIDVGGYFDKLISTDNHPVSKYFDKEIKWEEAKNIKEGDEIAYPVYEPSDQYFYSNDVLIDSKLAYVLGLYAAEGNIRVNSQVTFTFSKKETEYAESVRDICDSVFGKCSIIEDYNFERSYIRVYVKNSKFARICHELLDRGSCYKKINYKIRNSPKEVRINFIKGYFDGDSNYGNRSLDVSSASKNLLLGVRDILLSLGIITSLTFRRQNNKNSHYALYCGGEDKRKLYKILGIEFFPPKGKGGKSWMRIKEINGMKFLLYKVKSVDLNYVDNIDVYNFTIKNEHTYIVDGFAVHNCGIPVVSTRCCGMLDFLNDDNSYLVDIAGYDVNKDVKQLSSYYQNMPFAVLNENTVNLLKETMRHITNNYSEAEEKANLLRKNICENFTWGLLVDRIYNRIQEF